MIARTLSLPIYPYELPHGWVDPDGVVSRNPFAEPPLPELDLEPEIVIEPAFVTGPQLPPLVLAPELVIEPAQLVEPELPELAVLPELRIEPEALVELELPELAVLPELRIEPEALVEPTLPSESDYVAALEPAVEPEAVIEREPLGEEPRVVAEFRKSDPEGWAWRECAPFEPAPTREGPPGPAHFLDRAGDPSSPGLYADEYREARAQGTCLPLEVVLGPTSVHRTEPEPIVADATGEDAIFSHIFGTPKRRREKDLIVPLVLDRRSRTDIRIRIGDDPAKLRMSGETLLALLEEDLRPDLHARLTRLVDEEGLVPLSSLTRVGVDARFDHPTLSLDVQVPPHSRGTRVIAFRGAQPPVASTTLLQPASFSGYLNSRIALDYLKDDSSGDQGLQPLQAVFEGATNLRNWVLEGDLTFREDAAHRWRRGDVRLVRDLPSRSIRVQGGDVSIHGFGFQARQNLLGVTIGRNFKLQPYRITEPSGSRRFTLTTRSRVEVMVNGRLLRTLHLRPGPYDLRDFRLTNGINDVQIRITDDFGRVREIDFPFAFESRLLRTGLSDFGYTVGVRSQRNDGLLEYDDSARVFSGFHRYGLTSNLTLGGHFQADRDRRLLGADAVFAGRYGTVAAEVAFSRGRGTRPSYGLRLRFQRYDARQRNTARRRWRFSFESRGRTFAPIGATNPDNATALSIGGSVSQDLPLTRTQGTFSADYDVGRGGAADTLSLSASLRRWLRKGLDVELSLGQMISSEGENELSSVVSLIWVDRERNHTTRVSHDSVGRATSLDWQYSPDRVVGGVAANTKFTNRPDAYDLAGGLRYTGARMEAALTQDTTFGRRGRPDSYRSSFQLGTAVAFAGKKLGLSRPITNSFALVVPHPSLKGHVVGVDPVGGTTTARADRFGPGVVPNLTAYKIRNVTVEAPDLPAGFDLGVTFFQTSPTYRSGTVIPVGKEAVVVMRGLLTLPDGSPMGLAVGKIESLDDPDFDTVTFFTNRKGKFSVSGLKPGRYEVRMHSNPDATIRIEIPRGTVGRFNVGGVRLPEVQ